MFKGEVLISQNDPVWNFGWLVGLDLGEAGETGTIQCGIEMFPAWFCRVRQQTTAL